MSYFVDSSEIMPSRGVIVRTVYCRGTNYLRLTLRERSNSLQFPWTPPCPPGLVRQCASKVETANHKQPPCTGSLKDELSYLGFAQITAAVAAPNPH